MALPWHIPLNAISHLTCPSSNTEIESFLLEHYCNIDIHKNPRDELQTGLMCEIGINIREPAIIQRLIAAGMTVARLNLRDLEPESCTQLIQSIRQAVFNYSSELKYVYPLALIADIRGPDIVTGDLKGGQKYMIELLENETIKLTTDPSWRECGTADCLYIGYDHLTDLKRDDAIYIDSLTSGQVKLVITDVGDDSVECIIAVGGTIGPKMTARIFKVPHEINNKRNMQDSSHSLLNKANSQHAFEYIKDQIGWAVSSDIDGIIVPNVQGIEDVHYVRDILSDKGKHILVFASIATFTGFDNIDSILSEVDGIYVDRFVLCNDVPIEKIFIAQKNILAKCNDLGKPCILKAVLNEQIPALCVTDIANLVLDGADVLALEFHYESPLKKIVPYDEIRMAEHCLAAVSVISRHAERITWPLNKSIKNPIIVEDPTRSICISAVELATRSRAVVIICLTSSGRTAKVISHVGPICPIVAVTRICHTARQLRFWKGVRSMHYFEAPKESWNSEVDSRIQAALDYCKAKRIISAGEAYVLVAGSRKGGGYCDSVRLLYASAKNTIYVE